MKFFFAIIVVVLNFCSVFSQQKAFVGFGAGLDYGGFGIRAEYQPTGRIGVFGGAGYNLVDPALNGGIVFKILLDKRVLPVVFAMYGYNAAIKVGSWAAFSRTYYGFTTGVGCEIYDRNKKNKLLLEILVPIRSSEFHDKYDYLKSVGYKFNPEILPVSFSIGYNFGFNKKRISNEISGATQN